MKIEHNIDEKKFVLLDDDGKEMGRLEYMMSRRNVMFARKTIINEEYRGRGLGKPLVDEISRYARENGYKIRPVCSFVKKMFEKYPEQYCDLAVDEADCSGDDDK